MKTYFIIYILLFSLSISCKKTVQVEHETNEGYQSEQMKEQHPYSALEVISDDFSLENLDTQQGEWYQWKNHSVLYGRLNDLNKIEKSIKTNFPGATIKIYKHPLYHFQRAVHCEHAKITSEWKHVLLTANLVKDEVKQQEYIDYHNNQFTEWPEVAQGFCNAQFQKLQVFKNDRQLLLVISIPKGENLDELNPKTTENNPRVDEWNKIMAQYQEGIEGTQKGETWVFLEKLEPELN